MSSISAWILSICGMVIISILVDIILPKKVLTKFVKSIVGILTVLVAFSPITNINLDNLNFTDMLSGVAVNDAFIENREEEKLSALKKSIESSISRNGYKNVEVCFEAEEENGLIKTVFVDLKKLVLSTEILNIDKYTNIVAIIKQFVSISEDKIIFYE